MNSERGLITYSKITAAGPEDSRPRLCDTFRKYLGQAEGPEQAGVPHSGAQARQRWRDCPRNAGPVRLRVNPRMLPAVSSLGLGRTPCRMPELEKGTCENMDAFHLGGTG